MSEISSADVNEIKRRLGRIEDRQETLVTSNAVMVTELRSLERNLPSQIDAAITARLIAHGKQGREVSGWLIAIISTAMFMVLALVQVGVLLWR